MADDASTATESALAEDSNEDVVSVTSDDSSFYGSNAVKTMYAGRAVAAVVYQHKRVHDWNIQVMAVRNVRRNPELWPEESRKRKWSVDATYKDSTPKKAKTEQEDSENRDLSLRPLSTKPHNPYAGSPSALQLNESIEDFLQRLNPSSPNTDEPWLWCAYFFATHQAEGGNVKIFRQVGLRMLEEFSAKRQRLEASFASPKVAGSITRILTAERKNLQEDIIRAARNHGVLSGKWMLFPTGHRVGEYWAAVVRATVEGRLGIAAKIATRPDKALNSTRVICVYTKDFEDQDDVKRVLLELVRLKLAPAIPGPLPKGANVSGQIWYKPECYTYLELMSGNEHKIKPTLYGTSSLLTAEDMRRL